MALSPPSLAQKEVAPRYEERLLIVTGPQSGFPSDFGKSQTVEPDRVYLGLTEGQVKIEEEEAHLLRAVNRGASTHKLSIPAPKVTRIPAYSCLGFKPGVSYRVAMATNSSRNILRDLDDADLCFSDEIVRVIEAEASVSKPSHRGTQRCALELSEKQEFRGSKFPDIHVSLPTDSIYSEDVLEWILTVLDIFFPAKIRQIFTTERNIYEAYIACRLVVLDCFELKNSVIKPPDCFIPRMPTDYIKRIAAEQHKIDQSSDLDVGTKGTSKRKVVVNEQLEKIASQVPFISRNLFASIFSYFVNKRKGTPLMPCMRDRPYRDWASSQANQKTFLVQQEKRFAQQFCKGIKRAQVPLYYFNRMAEFVCLREIIELDAITNECKDLLTQLGYNSNGEAEAMLRDDAPDSMLIPMDRPANTYKLEQLSLDMYDEAMWAKNRNQLMAHAPISKAVTSRSPSMFDITKLTSIVDIFANVGCLQKSPEIAVDEDVVNAFYQRILASST
ncbi:Hypothetical protein GLP15_2249 [Giardia lamblia P15]|uniref:Uncharacterized protein n=1 Tax=Giardia intestinalis (strain P15) TaxID=658858 RepID=E1F739_GIAIA|nr:Hypothetical protein GLP15_2249 [Giardia lamblia P15]